ncbi:MULTISPECIES: glycosyl transferase [unclassified Leptolyngbya]|uniref:glycosyl transferase n=1 Tax=unclassified Leptolyngbya TaxID=2650499 RepID=UPI001687834D|nr:MULTISPECIES: glycosyl transferase [unclassified Leptolyngbya]MBD1909981.1 glycosyl transferase [Leptolyngbya sp. FACHB-8]MBD2155194.1 glycosyl transferase [Leptolyngbya sp. FACHB-16]
MPEPILYVAVTNHGFGHATRTASVVAEIQRQCPDIRIIITTTAPRWLLESYIEGDFVHRPRAFDLGVVQSDSITMDKAATLEKLNHIRERARATIASEVTFLKQNRVGLILGDIPPLLPPMARAAGIPCWMMSNFGWDFIYRDWGEEFYGIADWIGECFGQCDRLFRLPFHEPMSAFPHIEDIGLTGGSPRHSAEEIRQLFDLQTPLEKTVLLTFGGLGLAEIPYQGLTQFPDWQFITFDQDAPELPNLLKVKTRFGSKYRPVDVMPVCGRVVSKPGYGTFSEACRTNTPLVTLTRRDFAEAQVLIDGVCDLLPHQILEPHEFYQANWEFLHEPLTSPRHPNSVTCDGNEAIARAVIDYLMP